MESVHLIYYTTMTISWNLRGIDVEVHYDLTPFDPGDYYNPPSGGYATVYGITLEDSDIDLLDLVGKLTEKTTPLPVESETATSDSSCCHRPRFEKTCIPQPFIKAQRCV